ncbi:COP1-interacting protein 7-like [Bidens hawaiensis]|uniref:COP1-interacting protein 7-like n=1 Tax=Bidens hawaiensis TaxID=980011 RepID=UPI00404B6DD7
MDSKMRLDYALFQLTPTRTRCDLIICAGDCKEKLASGLLEPFISHLKFAKDEAAKGGYSITLSAPDSASWFTKSTLERFVRFVSTPEVLERFVTIETEIKNIDGSINTNAASDSQTIYSLDEHLNKSNALANKPEDNTSDTLHEDDSKIHLQRALETRKLVLQREQAMVYARALVVGFETDVLQDLICFADAFGSPRLREACLSFIELCHTKSNDRVWMDEVAAMQAYSRSQYSYMEDDLGQELRINVQNGNFATKTQNESPLPQYMHSYQGGPMFHPAYQGYPFPYYQGNLPWPPEDSRSSGRHSHKKRSKKLTQDGGSDSSDSSDSDSCKRSSAKKVIIRNVNYITSARDEESEHESDANREGQKVTQQWNIFQNLLMKDADDQESMEEYVSHKFEDPNIIPSGNQPEFTNISSTTTKHEEKDWYLKSTPNKGSPERSRDIFEDRIEVVESTKDVHAQYNMTVQDRSLNEDSDSRLKTPDSFMVSESNVTQKKVEAMRVNEQNDLHMVLERDVAGNQAVPAWTPEMESDNRNTKIVKMDSPEVNKSKTKGLVEKGLVKKGSILETKSKALAGTRKKMPAATKTTIVKGRSEKEEEKRKKMQELLTERQKRIAERSASTAKTAKYIKRKAQLTKAQQTIKNDKLKAQQTIKTDKPKAQQTTKNDKLKTQQTAKSIKPKAQPTTNYNKPKAQQTPNYNKPKAQQTPKTQIASRDVKSSNKAVIRSSTIDRLSTARVVNPKVLPTKPKPGNNPMKPPTKKNGVPRTLLSQKAAEVEKKKENPKKAKPLGNNIVSKNSYGPKKKIVEQNKSKQVPKASQIKKTGNAVAHNGSSTHAYSDTIKSVSETLPKASSVAQKDTIVSESNSGSTNKAVSFKINEDFNGAKKNSIAKAKHEAPVMETLTLLPAKVSSESSGSKKKWRSLETPSKALSSFKKLLSFGRRS